MTIEQELEAALAKVSELTVERDTARDQAQKNFADFKAKSARVEELESEATAATEGFVLASVSAESLAVNLTTELEAARNLSTEKINAEAARIVASGGHPPIALGSTENPATAEPKKPELKGRAKATAYFASRMPKPATA